MGVSPISYTEIYAWSLLKDIFPSPWEVDLIRTLDAVYISESAKRK